MMQGTKQQHDEGGPHTGDEETMLHRETAIQCYMLVRQQVHLQEAATSTRAASRVSFLGPQESDKPSHWHGCISLKGFSCKKQTNKTKQTTKHFILDCLKALLGHLVSGTGRQNPERAGSMGHHL